MNKKVRNVGLVAAGIMATAIPCMAEGTAVDYSTVLAGTKTDLQNLVTTAGVPALGILVVMLGFGLVWKLVKKGAKSI